MGLLRGLAQASGVSRPAVAVARRVARRQALLWRDRVEDGHGDLAGTLERLAVLRQHGLLSVGRVALTATTTIR